MSKKPTMYPPVAFVNTPTPPRNPENTGTPASPSMRYTAIAIVPSQPPRIVSAAATPKICIVKEIAGSGIVIHAHTAITALIRAIAHIFRTLTRPALLLFVVTLTINHSSVILLIIPAPPRRPKPHAPEIYSAAPLPLIVQTTVTISVTSMSSGSMSRL